MQVRVLGMVWYRPENFQRLRAMFVDGDKLHATYEEWLAAAEFGRKKLEANGTRVVCVDIDPDTFFVWCEKRGLKPDATARNEYASIVCQGQH